jgi:hypothetical protein
MERSDTFISGCLRFISSTCAGSSGPVHNVILIDVYLYLETPGGRDFWVKGNRWVADGTKRVSLRATGSRGGRILTQQGGFQVSRQGEQGEQGEQGADHVHELNFCLVYVCDE